MQSVVGDAWGRRAASRPRGPGVRAGVTKRITRGARTPTGSACQNVRVGGFSKQRRARSGTGGAALARVPAREVPVRDSVTARSGHESRNSRRAYGARDLTPINESVQQTVRGTVLSGPQPFRLNQEKTYGIQDDRHTYRRKQDNVHGTMPERFERRERALHNTHIPNPPSEFVTPISRQ